MDTPARVLAALFLAVALVPSTVGAPAPPLTALAPFDIWADGFDALRGLAVRADGVVFIADRHAGTVTRIAPDRSTAVMASGLERPTGLALDPADRLLIAEERAGRVTRLDPGGVLTPVASGIKQPRWLAAGADGTVYVSARRLTRDADPEPDDESAEPEVILALTPEGRLHVFADGLRQVQGLAVAPGVVFAATRGRRAEPRVDGVVFAIPVQSDGGAGSLRALGPADAYQRPVGLARDRLGALFLTTRALDLADDASKRAVAKLHPTGAVTSFAANLDRPQGAAFDADGNLFVADGERLLRFQAPAAPALGPLPPFTNQPSVALTGLAEPGARIAVAVSGTPPTAATTAGATGAFTLTVPLGAEQANALEVVATGAAGHGLTGPPAVTTIVHDGAAPLLAFVRPAAGAHVRATVSVEAQAADAASGVAALALTAGGQPLPGVLVPAPPAAVTTATAPWDTAVLADGVHALAATATDRAGNGAAVGRVVVVDNTPPDTLIVDGPEGAASETAATFTVAGGDNLTPADGLEYAWRLDASAWSAFGPATRISVGGLAAGAHLFEAKARDRAGNEDPTPAARSFTVGAGVRVTITEPADGASVPAGPLLVRGTVDAGGAEVGVAVNGTPAAIQGTTFAALVVVDPDTPSITATATTAAATATHTVTVIAGAPAEARLLLRAAPSAGVAPLTVEFSLVGEAGMTAVALDADGDGTVDFEGPGLADQPFTYTAPGTYVPTVQVSDASGGVTTARALVEVYDATALDTALQATWSALRGALQQADVEGAVALFAQASQSAYRSQLAALHGVGALGQIAADLGPITLVRFREGAAEYDLRAVRDGVEYSFHVLFVLDTDGRWRLAAF